MANTVSSTTKVKIRQAPRIKVSVNDAGALQSTTPVTLKNQIADEAFLTELYDVNINNPVDYGMLVYEANTTQWVNRPPFDFLANGNAFALTNTTPYDYSLSLAPIVTIQSGLVVGNSFSTNSTVTFVASANIGAAYIANAVIVGGTSVVHDIIPDANNLYTLGNTTNRFATLYLSGDTLYMGNVVFEDTGTNLYINDANGNPISLNVGNTVVAGGLSVTQGFAANSLTANTLLINRTANIVGNTAIGNSTFFVDTTNNRIGVNEPAPVATISVGAGNGGPNSGIRLGDMELFAFANAGSNRGAPTFRTAISNSQTVLRVLPNGVPSVNDFTTQTQFEFFATDYFSNTTNWHNFRIIAQPNRFVIDTARGANTDSPMPIVFDIGGTGSSNATNANYPAVLVLAANGTVGVGTASPDAKFKVQGTANISGNVAIGGTLTVGGNTSFTSNVQVTGTANVTGNLQVTDTITGNNLTLTGNLTVSGTTTYINTTTLNVGDNIITLNADAVGTPTENAGIEINRGSSANVSFIWVEADDVWALGNTRIAGVASIISDNSIAGATYTGKTFSILAQDSTGTGLWFSPDGVYMYVVGQSADAVQQYTLSTPWDVTTASYTQNFSVVAQDTATTDLYFRADGLKMYIAADTLNAVLEYTLSTAWNVTTATYTQQFSVASQEGSVAGIFFKSDGTKMYVVGSGSDAVFQYSLSTPWDISTSTYVSSSASIALQDTSSSALWITADGVTMYMMGSSTDAIYQYTLATPWDVSTATYTGTTVYIGHTEQGPLEFFFNESLGKIWVGGSTSDAIREYVVTPAAEIVANTLVVSASVLRSDATLVVANAAYFVGSGLTVYNTTNLGTTSIGGTLTATSTISLAGSTTSTTTLGTGASTGTTTIGGTGQTGSITVGQSTVSQAVNIATGAANSTATKTVNIGTSGVSGSITNINIGSSVAGALGNTTVYSQNFLVGANLIANTSALMIGNTTVNAVANSSLIKIANSTAIANLTPNSLVLGITTVNSTSVSVGANVYANATYVYVGNSTVYSAYQSTQMAVANSSYGFYATPGNIAVMNGSDGTVTIGNDNLNGAIEIGKFGRTTLGTPYIDFHSSAGSPDYDVRIMAAGGNSTPGSGNVQIFANVVNVPNTVITGTANASVAFNVGANVQANTTAIFVGNSTVNSVITSASITSNNISTNNIVVNTATFNVSANVGANVQLTTSQLSIGNATVNTIITSSSVFTGNVTTTGFINVATTANIGGAITARSTVTVNGALTVANTAALGNTTITGFANVVGNLQITDTVTGNNLTLTGNLTVSGTTTYINTTTLNVGDNIITLNADLGAAVAPTENVGIEVNRGSAANVQFVWDETNDYWTHGNTVITGTANVQGQFAVANSTATQFVVSPSANAVNYLQVTGSASLASAPTIAAVGSDANIPLRLTFKGNGGGVGGGVQITNPAGWNGLAVQTVNNPNYVNILGVASGGGPIISVLGVDTNADLNLAPRGSGVTASSGPVQVETDTVVTTKSITTISNTAGQVIAVFDGATYRSAEFIIQATDATGTKYQKTKMLAVHNGTTAEYVEYGSVNVGGDCGTFDVAYSAGIQLRVTPSSSNSTVFKVTCILTKL